MSLCKDYSFDNVINAVLNINGKALLSPQNAEGKRTFWPAVALELIGSQPSYEAKVKRLSISLYNAYHKNSEHWNETINARLQEENQEENQQVAFNNDLPEIEPVEPAPPNPNDEAVIPDELEQAHQLLQENGYMNLIDEILLKDLEGVDLIAEQELPLKDTPKKAEHDPKSPPRSPPHGSAPANYSGNSTTGAGDITEGQEMQYDFGKNFKTELEVQLCGPDSGQQFSVAIRNAVVPEEWMRRIVNPNYNNLGDAGSCSDEPKSVSEKPHQEIDVSDDCLNSPPLGVTITEFFGDDHEMHTSVAYPIITFPEEISEENDECTSRAICGSSYTGDLSMVRVKFPQSSEALKTVESMLGPLFQVNEENMAGGNESPKNTAQSEADSASRDHPDDEQQSEIPEGFQEVQLPPSFNITLPKEWWEKYCLGPSQTRLTKGWTPAVAEKFQEQNHVCVIHFTTNHIVLATSKKSKGYAVKFTAFAKCTGKMCKCSFRFTADNVVLGEDVVMTVVINGNCIHSHTEKLRRHCTGDERHALKERLKCTTPNMLKRTLVKEKCHSDKGKVSLDHGNYNGCFSLSTLQQLSSERVRAEDLDIDAWKDVVKQVEQYDRQRTIKFVPICARKPLMIAWHSEEQIELFRKGGFLCAHLDATGNCVKKPDEQMPGQLLSYAITVQSVKGKSPIPVAQLVSTGNKTHQIEYWLKEFRARVKETCPNRQILVKMLVMDMSWVLTRAATNTFCNIEVETYLKESLNWKSLGNVPVSLVLWCYAHLLAAIGRKLSRIVPQAGGDGKRARRLALLCVATLARMTSLEEACEFVKAMTTLFSSSFFSEEVQLAFDVVDETVCHNDKVEPEIPGDKEEIPAEDMDFPDGKTLYSKSPFYKAFKTTIDSATVCTTGGTKHYPDEKNPFQIPKFIDFLSKFYLAYYPFWSLYLIVLVDKTLKNPPTNWPVEVFFKSWKRETLEQNLHQPVGRFVRKGVIDADARLLVHEYDPDFKKYQKALVDSTERHDEQLPFDEDDPDPSDDILQEETFKPKRRKRDPLYSRGMQIMHNLKKKLNPNDMEVTVQKSAATEKKKEKLPETPQPDESVPELVKPWTEGGKWPEIWLREDDVVVGSLDLTLKCRTSLTCGKWVDGAIIDQFIQAQANCARQLGHFVQPVSSLFYNNLQEERLTNMRWAEARAVHTAEVILFPLNPNKAHWSLAVVVTDAKCVVILDSKTEGQFFKKSDASKIMKYLNTLYTCSGTPTNWDDRKIFRPTDIPFQKNGHDCGPFIMVFAYMLCQKQFFKFEEQDMPNVRRWVAETLLTTNCNIPRFRREGTTWNQLNRFLHDPTPKAKVILEPPMKFTSTMKWLASVLSDKKRPGVSRQLVN